MKRETYYTDLEHPDRFYEEFHIPKKNGKTRRICAPSPALKAYQRTLLPELYESFQRIAMVRGVADMFHGFLPNKNIVTAALKHVGYATTIQMDISNCFDNIEGDWLENPNIVYKDGSLAQGFVTSPILANIYLTEVLSDVNKALTDLGIETSITCYADDLTISTNSTDYNIINLIPIVVTQMVEKHELKINRSKTRIRHSKYGRRKILGIMVGETDIKPSKKLKGKIRAARHQGNGPSLGGLVTASRCYLPRAIRITPD